MANPLQEFHVFTTHARLAELEELMRSRWIVQDDLEDIWAEEVGDAVDDDAIAGDGPLGRSCGLRWWRCWASLRRWFFRRGDDVAKVEAMMAGRARRSTTELSVPQVGHPSALRIGWT